MEDVNLPLISVIVPVYNVGEYLEQCINSIIKQTYSNIELILVDDGSTDSSKDICDEYERYDYRIKVIHKKNGGLVSARKKGVLAAKGDYVSFVDGDDWIDTDTLQKLIKVGNGADIITYACCEEYGDYQIVKRNSVPEGMYDISKKNSLYRKMLMNNFFFEFGVIPHLCDKLIRKEILEQNQMLVSDKISYGEDVACAYPCMIDATSICITNMPLYHYRQRMGSIVKSNSDINPDNFKAIYNLLRTKFGEVDKYNTELMTQLHYYMWFILLVKAYKRINNDDTNLFPFTKISGKMKIGIYGAGGFGKVIKEYCDNSYYLEVMGWFDSQATTYQGQGYNVKNIDEIQKIDFDYIIIAILNERVASEVKEILVKRGIEEEKIDWVKRSVLIGEKLPDWIVN